VLADVVEITLRKMRRDGVPIPFILEQLLPTSPTAIDGPTFVDANPAGGFLAELEDGKTPVRAKAPAKRKAAR
jgi:hypothetical protein